MLRTAEWLYYVAMEDKKMRFGGAQCRLLVHNVALYHWSGAQRRSHTPTHTYSARLTTVYFAPSQTELITNMQNRLVHHLISTKLRCASHRRRSSLCTMGRWFTTTDFGAPWCTAQVGGAQHRSMVHNIFCTHYVVVHNAGLTKPHTHRQYRFYYLGHWHGR